MSPWKALRQEALAWLEAGLVDEREYLRLMRGIDDRLAALRPDARKRREIVAQLLLLGGVTLILAGVIYFIAANWQGIPRGYKVVLLVIGTVGAYASGGYFLYRQSPDRVTGNLLIIVGSWLFGVSLALVGQIYNSHADSWQLFAVWALPCIGLACLMRSHYFAIKSLLLFNFGLWLWLFPMSWLQPLEENLRVGCMAIAVANALIFAAMSRWPRSWTMAARYVAYLSTLIFAIALTMVGDRNTSGWWSLGFAVLLVASVIYYVEVKLDEWLVYTTLILGAIWTFMKVAQWLFPEVGDSFPIVLIAFGVVWLGLNTLVFSWINRRIRERQGLGIVD